MKLQTPNAVATKNALYPKFVIAGYGANAQASTTSVCTRPPHTQPPGPPPQPWPSAVPVPGSCPGVPPLAATYTISADGPSGLWVATLTNLGGCTWYDGGGPYGGAFLILDDAVRWRVSTPAEDWELTSGATPIGTYAYYQGFNVLTSISISA